MIDLAVYLINLDGSDQRLRNATAQLESEGIAFERVAAFDGRALLVDQFPDYHRKAAMAYMGRPLRGDEIGCYLSHLDCARRFLASGARYGLVLEDDLQLVQGFAMGLAKMIDWLAQSSIQWDVINIGADRLKYITPLSGFEAEGRIFTLVRAHYFPMTTTGILWSLPGAQRFLSQHQAIYAPVDNALREWQCIEGRGLSVMPPLVMTTGAISDIDGGQAKRKLKGRSPLYSWRKQKRVWRNKLRALRHQLANPNSRRG